MLVLVLVEVDIIGGSVSEAVTWDQGKYDHSVEEDMNSGCVVNSGLHAVWSECRAF